MTGKERLSLLRAREVEADVRGIGTSLDGDTRFLIDEVAKRDMEIRRLRDALVSARWRLSKGRALWNGPCHECDAALERGLTGKEVRSTASDMERRVIEEDHGHDHA